MTWEELRNAVHKMLPEQEFGSIYIGLDDWKHSHEHSISDTLRYQVWSDRKSMHLVENASSPERLLQKLAQALEDLRPQEQKPPEDDMPGQEEEETDNATA